MSELCKSLEKPARILKTMLEGASRVRITTHKSPDGDALGSLTAFAGICTYLKKEYDLVLDDDPPSNLLFLPKISEICRYSPDDAQLSYNNELTDLIVYLDCGQLSRAGFIENSITKTQKIVNIDHHHKNPEFGCLNIVRDVSSTAEILAVLVDLMEIPYTKEIATSLYTGMMTDTGSFIFEKSSPNTYRIAARLLEQGISPSEIHQKVNLSLPKGWYTLVKKMIDNLKIFCDGKVVISSISLQDVQDAEGFDLVNHLLPLMSSVEGVEVYVLIKEKEDGTVSASLRSKKDVDVSEIAAVFGGGGHRRAAACRVENQSMADFLNYFIPKLLEILSSKFGI